jgi:hypothetical protein
VSHCLTKIQIDLENGLGFGVSVFVVLLWYIIAGGWESKMTKFSGGGCATSP